MRKRAHGSFDVRSPLAAVALVVLVAACGDGSGGDYAWVALGANGAASVRAVTTAGECPVLDVDGASVPMTVRAAAEPPLFPVLTCEADLPPGTSRAAVGGRRLPLPPAHVGRIAVIGDTGCRLSSSETQACNDPAAFPFATVARAVAALDPDLIIHVGDYLYREAPCPPGNDGCAGSPWGYNWATIEADFFAPGRPLLGTAPLVLVRGNHELCARAGPVWFRFLEPGPLPDECVDYTEPYALEVGELPLLMLDSSAASDTSVSPEQVALYRPQFERIGDLARPGAFLLTHRPMWVFGHAGEQNGMEQLFRSNPTLEAASENMLPAAVHAVLSGHVHLLELLDFDAARPPQLVVGNSGTELDPAIMTPLAGLEIGGAVVRLGVTDDSFGFTTLDRAGDAWLVATRDVRGETTRECVLDAAGLACP